MDDIGVDEVRFADEVAAACIARSRHLVALLGSLDPTELHTPSELPGWSRLTIACHLRFGTRTLVRMTRDTLAGVETSYYPRGRATQRPLSLQPARGESPQQVLDEWRSAVDELEQEWGGLTDQQWRTTVLEPDDNRDLGPVPLARLALAGLTEVDVHGTDLGIGAPGWSPTLVRVGLPARLGWLSTRRTNHRNFDTSIRGSWRLEATEGLGWFVAVDEERVISRPGRSNDHPTATIAASSRDLLALLLGRPCVDEPVISGDVAFAASFPRAFPGP